MEATTAEDAAPSTAEDAAPSGTDAEKARVVSSRSNTWPLHSPAAPLSLLIAAQGSLS